MEKKEAMEILKGFYDKSALPVIRTALGTLIPELENEDKSWIPKEIIEYLKEKGGFRSCWIAWLEKQQGEKKLENSAKTFKDEQNHPADKVEPKFKVGDWVVNKFGHLKHITKIENHCYYAEGECGEWRGTFEYGDTHFHLWTIKDVKDGDVLADDDSIMFFRKIDNDIWNGVIDFYICYNSRSDKIIIQKDILHCGTIKEKTIKPATKEQRDLLFEKMEEAGYKLNWIL